MRELIRDVAEVINNLETLNLLDREDVVTEVRLNPKTKKNELKVAISVQNKDIVRVCLRMFQELSMKNHHSMGILENNLRSKLTVEFYEK